VLQDSDGAGYAVDDKAVFLLLNGGSAGAGAVAFDVIVGVCAVFSCQL
jgi:hypothetical protein